MASGPWWGLPAGQGDWEAIWRTWGSPFPPLPPFLGASPALPGCGLLPPPPLSLLAPPVSAPGELPCPAGAALCCWPVEEAPWRAKAAASRESTAALKAWLGRHRKNPYPTKGEKVLLALVSRMSLTQVSTWFANARRRLKKEPRRPDDAPDAASPAPRRPRPSPRPPSPPRQEEEEEEEPPRKQAKIWCLAELAAAAPPEAPAAPPGLQR